MGVIKKSDLSGCTDRYNVLKASVTFPTETTAPSVNTSTQDAKIPDKVTLASLQTCIHSMESLFSNNCNCLVNTDCCQTCQSASCQTSSCQSQYCQSCQGCQTCQGCQSCQAQCDCNCNCDCSGNNGG